MDLEKIIALNISVELSKKICRKITIQTERYFQSIDKPRITREPLKNIWNDVCYQYQKEGSCGMVYDLMIREHVGSLVKDLEDYEFNAIYLQIESPHTDLANTDTSMATGVDEHKSIRMYSFKNEVIGYITEEYIYKRAKNYTNKRLRKALSNLSEIENS